MARLHTHRDHPLVPGVCKSPPLSLCKHVFCISLVSTTGQNTCLHSGLFQKLQAPMTPSLLWMYDTGWELQNHHHHHHLTERSGHVTLVVGKPANCHWFRLKLLPHPKSGFREWENWSSFHQFPPHLKLPNLPHSQISLNCSITTNELARSDSWFSIANTNG
mgnify:FL=1